MNGLARVGTLVSSGFVALDVVLHGDDIGHAAGGTAGNVAANVSFLGWKADIIGDIGDDPAGRQVVGSLQRARVGVSQLQLHAGASTPVVIHEVVDGRHRFRFGCPQCGRRFPHHRPLTIGAANAYLKLNNPDVVFFDRSSSGALRLAEEARKRGRLVVFEPASLGDEARFRRASNVADIVKFSDERAPRFEAFLLPRRGQIQIKTLGARGVAWRRDLMPWSTIPAIPAPQAVDSGGAGDWMTAGILSSLDSLRPETLGEQDWEHALNCAQALAATSCRALGARGLSDVMTAARVREAVSALVGEDMYDLGAQQTVLARSIAPATCGACLA